MEKGEKINKFNSIKERIEKNKKRFLEEFEKSVGIITTTSQKTGMNRGTYYQWLKKDPKFRKEIERIKEEQMGVVEDRLLQAILNNNVSAIIFYLKCKHPEYRPKSELSFDKEATDKALDRIKEVIEND